MGLAFSIQRLGIFGPDSDEQERKSMKEHHPVKTGAFWLHKKALKCIVPRRPFGIVSCHTFLFEDLAPNYFLYRFDQPFLT